MIFVTGASGQLGHLVIDTLLTKVAASEIIAGVRTIAKAEDLSTKGVQLRSIDYTQPDTLTAALQGVTKLLLISSSEVGQRLPQHKNVIDAAKAAGVESIYYTSLLHADTSPLGLAAEHVATEAYLAESGVNYVILRNGWYTENYLASVPSALEHGVFLGCAGDGKIASAARADYAAAAATALIQTVASGTVYELAGDESYTLTELAAALSDEVGKEIPYNNLEQQAFSDILIGAGLPAPLAELLADSDTGASNGALFDDSQTLSQLIQRPTTRLETLIKQALNS